MHSAMAVEDAAFTAQPKGHAAHQMPLTFLQAGEQARVIKVRGNDEIHHHLENLGFVAGAPVRVVNKLSGNLIVEVKGAQVALDRSAASKIIAG
ncbi:FeoA family protein [Adlercreutzia murintestinalis]|uniref:FeoA family protein n=1 Tax=Adlercreutzia murintestinalis TaxID=2941325 RepID=UPI00203DC886|nr:FeoA family protein [Adlercreutzia murintestinalis]